MDEQKRFSTMKNGYNRYEVDEEIKRLTDSLNEVRIEEDRNRKLAEQAGEQLAVIKDRYRVLINELSMREKAADDLSRIALKEANQIIAAAQDNADSIVREALVTARTLLLEIARIADDANDVKADMQDNLNALQQTLDEFVIIEPIDKKFLRK